MTTSNSHVLRVSLLKKELSRHAQKRSQQRGISSAHIRLIQAFGDQEHDGHGGIRFFMSVNALSRVRRAVGSSVQLDSLAGAYVVVSAEDGKVVTVGHRLH